MAMLIAREGRSFVPGHISASILHSDCHAAVERTARRVGAGNEREVVGAADGRQTMRLARADNYQSFLSSFLCSLSVRQHRKSWPIRQLFTLKMLRQV
ncbi:hypothetical protein G3N95_25615 [Paraburkholderia sp. Tr-20389]|nr:hypothetical protein [Paraburkholderia sp. Tr-20389]